MQDRSISDKYSHSVMIWRYKVEDDRRVIVDVEKDDLRIIRYAVEAYLR